MILYRSNSVVITMLNDYIYIIHAYNNNVNKKIIVNIFKLQVLIKEKKRMPSYKYLL